MSHSVPAVVACTLTPDQLRCASGDLRLCCRFLHFALDVPPNDSPIELTVRGPVGTGDFLATLDPLFAAT